MTYRICSISGGGVKGVIPAAIIKEMLNISKELGGKGKITDICDYVVGTSVGGIIGAALVASEDKEKARNEKTAKYQVDEVVDILKNNAEKIFPEDGIGNDLLMGLITGLPVLAFVSPLKAIMIGGVTSIISYLYTDTQYIKPKYSRDGIDELLNEYFGDLKLSDVVIPFTTVSFSLDQDKPRIWSTFRADKTVPDDFFIKDALGATSAAPTYFPFKHTKTKQGDFYDIDGGIFSNSPLNLAISVLHKYATDDVRNKILKEGISVISIGTGHINTAEFTPPSLIKQGAVLSAINLLLKTMEATEKDSLIQASYSYNFMRLDPLLNKKLVDEMDNSKNVPELLSVAEKFNKNNHDIIESYVKCLYYKGGFGNQDTCSELQIIDKHEYAFDTYEFSDQ